MMLSVGVDFILSALKIIGVIGAFAGFSSEGGSDKKRKSRVSYLFLAVAISAEICDSAIKYRDGREQVERFQRLAHPLGDIHIVAFYNISLKDKLVENYRKNIYIRHSLEPDQKSEMMAYWLLADSPDFRVFFFKKGVQLTRGTEPNLSFSVNFPDDGRPLQGGPRYPKLVPTVAKVRNYVLIDHETAESMRSPHFAEDTITAQIQDTNTEHSRYSDGEIVSSQDILGSTIEVIFCPTIFLPETSANDERGIELEKLVTLDEIYVRVPNRKEFSISPDDKKNVIVTHDSCTVFTMKVPDNENEFDKIVVP
jgi:hypothetical protein